MSSVISHGKYDKYASVARCSTSMLTGLVPLCSADLCPAAGKYMKSQKEINLGKDLEMRDRKDIYRNFLLFCVSGDVVQLPMGSTGRLSGL